MVSMTTPSLNNSPIGVMDSGVGGISVLKHIHALLPHENLHYFADSHYAPYGSKSAEAITQRCVNIADYLIAQHAKTIVVACNTATAAAITTLRGRYQIPIIGMEPAVKPAAEATKNGIIGVLATVGTLKSAQFAALLENYGKDIKVITRGCEGLVECVENGALNTPQTKALITHYCAPLLAEGADTIVLGCTHYPFLRETIAEVVGNSITLIDTGAAVAMQLKRQLDTHKLHANHLHRAHITFNTNSKLPNATQVIDTLWGAFSQTPYSVVTHKPEWV
ncbi:MAG: glutamate racemase [Methylophilus sp.]|nr:glutamate racemase [Methylophilus sp.]